MVHWFSIYTQPGCELKVAENLTRKGIENYCPVVKSIKKAGSAKKTGLIPLFTSFLYVRMKEEELGRLRNADPSVTVMYWLQKPAVIKDVEIDMLKTFLKEYENIRLEKSEVNMNEMVKLVNEPHVEGDIVMENYCQLKLVLPSIGFTLVAVVHTGEEEILHRKEAAFLPRTDAELIVGTDY